MNIKANVTIDNIEQKNQNRRKHVRYIYATKNIRRPNLASIRGF